MAHFQRTEWFKAIESLVEAHPPLHAFHWNGFEGLPHERYLAAAITGTCFASAAHFLAAFIPAGCICTGRIGCMAAGRTDATGLSTTGRTGWTLVRVTGRATAGRWTAALTE